MRASSSGNYMHSFFTHHLIFLKQYVTINGLICYVTDYLSTWVLSSVQQGKGEFTMEYREHSPVSQEVQMQLVNNFKASKNTTE